MRGAEEMRAAFARLGESGLSMKAFAQREGIAYTTMQYWRRRLSEAPKDEARSAREPLVLTPVRIVPDSPPVAESKAFEVWLANGVSLEVPRGFDEGELRRLVGVLSAC